MKKICCVLLAFIFAFSFSVSTLAATNAVTVLPHLSFSGTTAECNVYIYQPQAQISARMELWYGSFVLDSWSGSGTTLLRLNGSRNVTSGLDYRLVVSGTVDGIPFSTYVEDTCP